MWGCNTTCIDNAHHIINQLNYSFIIIKLMNLIYCLLIKLFFLNKIISVQSIAQLYELTMMQNVQLK